MSITASIKNKLWIQLLVVCILINGKAKVRAQEDHYWNSHIGAKSALIGGAVTASVRDNSAIYYNPGALGFLNRSNLSLTASMYNYRNNYIENGAGDGLNLFYETMEAVPQFISGVVKIPKLEKYTFVFAAFNTVNSNTRYHYRQKQEIDLLDSHPGNENYYGKFEYNSKIREDWSGIGVAFKSWENSSIGISNFIVFRTLDTRHELSTNVINGQNNQQQLAARSLNRDVYMFMVSNIIKVGYSYENEWFRLGVTMTSPGIPLHTFSSARLGWNEELNAFDDQDNTMITDVYEEGLRPKYTYPFNFDIGGQFLLFNSTISFRYSWYAPVKNYKLVSFTRDADFLSNQYTELQDEFSSVWYNGKGIGNIGVGIEKPYNDRLSVLLGFNTNNNAVNRKILDDENKWVPTVSYWNLYNFSFGVEWLTKNENNLVLGLSCAMNHRKNDTQLINLSDPLVENGLVGYNTKTANTQILNIGFVFGYTFNFKTKLERDLLEEAKSKLK